MNKFEEWWFIHAPRGELESGRKLAEKIWSAALAASNDQVIELGKQVHHWTCEALGLNNELTAANERINDLTEKLDCANALSKRNGLAYCAARELADKLMETLLMHGMTASNIAEVEAIRKGGAA